MMDGGRDVLARRIQFADLEVGQDVYVSVGMCGAV